jgi:hypothetical protein
VATTSQSSGHAQSVSRLTPGLGLEADKIRISGLMSAHVAMSGDRQEKGVRRGWATARGRVDQRVQSSSDRENKSVGHKVSALARSLAEDLSAQDADGTASTGQDDPITRLANKYDEEWAESNPSSRVTNLHSWPTRMSRHALASTHHHEHNALLLKWDLATQVQ